MNTLRQAEAAAASSDRTVAGRLKPGSLSATAWRVPSTAHRRRLGLMFSAAVASTSNAAIAPHTSPQLEEIVVTGTKRDASAQEVPISVSTVNAEQLGISPFNDIRALGQQAPGLVLSNPSGFNAALSWMDHEYTGGELPDLLGGGDPVRLEDFEAPFSPRLKAMLSAEYRLPIAPGDLVFGASVNHQDQAQTDVFNSARTQMHERSLVNLSIALEERAGFWSLRAFVANATDERYRIAALPVAGLWNFTNFGAPRSYGVRFRYNFGALR